MDNDITRTIYHTSDVISCRECGKKFTEMRYLIRHQATHKGGKGFECKECGEEFFRAGDLMYHRRKHNKGNKSFLFWRPYKCITGGNITKAINHN